MIHWRPDTPAPSDRWMVGRAVLTTRLSSIGMNRPNTIAARIHHLRRSDPLTVWGEVVRSARAIGPSFRWDACPESLSECSLIRQMGLTLDTCSVQYLQHASI